jgi:diacylglycerol kinase family enzyme
VKPLLICNPASRGGRGRRLSRRVLDTLQRTGPACDHVFTESLDHAVRLSREANHERRPLVVAVGGDGTINRVLNGFFDTHGRRVSDTRFGVVHTGTSPDFCRSYGLPANPIEAVRCIGEAPTRSVPVGMVEYARAPVCERAVNSIREREARAVSFFACCANVGLGPHLARAANSGIRRVTGDTVGTLLALLAVLPRYRAIPCEMALDGAVAQSGPICNVSIGLTRYIASGIKVHVDPRSLDGRLYVMRVKSFGFGRLPFVLRTIYGGRRIPPNDIISLEYAAEVEMRVNGRFAEVEYDGDPAGYLPCRCRVAPDPIDVLRGEKPC